MTPRFRGLAVLFAGAAGLALFLLTARRPLEAPPPPRIRRPSAVVQPSPEIVRPTRNVFEYASAPAAPAPAWSPKPRPEPEVETAAAAPPVPPAVRFLGLVRRGGALKAALSFRGETVVLGVGEEEGGYRVTAVDDDGVRLVAPDGTTLTLFAQ